VIVLESYLSKAYAYPGVEQRIYTVNLPYSLNNTITLYCTAVLVNILFFLLCNQERWRSNVKCLAEARMCCLVKPDGISNVVVMDGSGAKVK